MGMISPLFRIGEINRCDFAFISCMTLSIPEPKWIFSVKLFSFLVRGVENNKSNYIKARYQHSLHLDSFKKFPYEIILTLLMSQIREYS